MDIASHALVWCNLLVHLNLVEIGPSAANRFQARTRDNNVESQAGFGKIVCGAISPMLSNVYLHSFDKMWQLYGLPGTKLVRYADDFVILCRSGGRLALRRVRDFLQRLGLSLHEEKTRLVQAGEGFDFLGMTFRYGRTHRQAQKLKYNCFRWPRGKALASLKEKIRQRIGRR